MFTRLCGWPAPPTGKAVVGASALLTAAMVTAGCTSPVPAAQAADSSVAQDKPNILMVLIDDLGYSDLSPYGGDVPTPNIDALARDGMQFTNFHAYPSCAPTRAALMTGQNPHKVGIGSQNGFAPPGIAATTPGYSGQLEGQPTGIAEVLSDADYRTYQVGKWHLGAQPDQNPTALGFDENFTLHEGVASHYADGLRAGLEGNPPSGAAHYERNGQPVESLPEDFYSTHAYTDEMLAMVEDGQDTDRPFFGYLAYTAVHDPLHVPDADSVARHAKRYLDNNDIDQLRAERIARLAERGLIDEDVAIRWIDQTPDWDSLTPEQRYDLAQRMAVYAAMIEDVDTQIGRIVDHLKESGEYDNTVITVASDNGAAGLPRMLYTAAPESREWQETNYPLVGDADAYGRAGSYPTLGFPNAQVSSGPYYHSKGTLFEGGTRVPLIIKPPVETASARGGSTIEAFTTISDLYPTFADYAGVLPGDQEDLIGRSAKPAIEGASDVIRDDGFGMEFLGQRAYWEENWKLVYAPDYYGGSGQFELFDLSADPGETNDLAAIHPDIVERLSTHWNQFAAENGVVPAPFDTVNEGVEALGRLMVTVDWAN